MTINRIFPESRMRRNRRSSWSREIFAENAVSISDLILPVFVTEGINIKIEIKSLPGVYRYSLDRLIEHLKEVVDLGILAIMIFPHIENHLKDEVGSLAFDQNNLMSKSIKAIKANFGTLGIIADVALDPYTSHGHDGIIDKSGYVLNDETVFLLQKQALILAESGVDAVAPSDMMDGRVQAIRKFLDSNSFQNTQIFSYSAKYASNFYGSFRNAVGSSSLLVGDKKSYQMDPANSNEAKSEVAADISEGADAVIIKPGMCYLDIISEIKNSYNIPIIAWQVSGEYSMIKLAIENQIFINPNSLWMEVMLSFKRAGANAIVSYASIEIAKMIKML